jgi:adenosylcobinamide kinase/adenosylcobinamide-phosphate guanylyltransferase
MGEILFVTGGARSGKSRFAERLAADAGARVTYLATLEPLDEEMQHRIARHRADRPGEWITVEEPLDLVAALQVIGGSDTVLLDCLSLWVSNRLARARRGASANGHRGARGHARDRAR